MKKILFLFIFSLIACTSENEKNAGGAENNGGFWNHNEFISTVKLPDTLDFCGEPVPIDDPEIRERAEREFYLLLQQPGQIMLYFKRSGRYFPMYERVMREMNMPEDLKYLSVAESALYQAKSWAGAVGLWQFMKATGRKYDLHVSSYVDERRHPEKSTYAAMEYLSDAYEKTNSWILSAAGYNMGVYGVQRRMNFQKSSNDYFDLFLNSETSRYIFRIVIIKEIMQHPEKYGFKIKKDDLYEPPNTETVSWGASIPDLSAWAIDNGTTYKHVKLLNPWIMKNRLRPPLSGQKYEILIPKREE